MPNPHNQGDYEDAIREKISAPMDERGGWTSASNAEADGLCAGRHQAQRGLSEVASDDATSGNRIHALLASEIPADGLTDDEVDCADKCRQIEEKLLAEVYPRTLNIPCHRERRLWTEVDGFKHSGKPDALYISNRVGLLVDYKTGRNEVAEASSNLQLRDLAVMAAETHGLESVIVAVIQPWVTMNPDVCEYSQTDLVIARSQMESRIISSNAPNATRTPSEAACKYCKAKAICPEARELALTPPMSAMPEGITPEAIAATLTADTLAKFLDRASFAEKVIDACRDEAKRRIAEGESIPGYKLKDGAIRENITDAQECWRRVCSRGVNVDQFMATVTIAKGKLKDLVKSATRLKGKDLETDLSIILDGITEQKQSEPSLVKAVI